MLKLQNKIALITGGTSGIGKATAIDFIEQGATVIITGRNQISVDATVKMLGENAHGIVADSANIEELKQLAIKVKALTGKVDVLYVNAGYGRFLMIEEVDEPHFDEIFNVIVKGTLFTVQSILPLMSEGGSIILNTSSATEQGLHGASVYSAAKSAVQSFVKTFAAELSTRKIRLNAVSPGPIESDFFINTGMNQEEIDNFTSVLLPKVPMARFGKSSEVAKAVTFLASDDSSYMHGTEIFVDGGQVQF
ncbi:SDR family oxidoreductase [Pedobacter hartonius]|uniref:NAD(P)-dependent dehydrogenase, short-chain alcohol dehydrogenase family n=1 Tax=Pedobacter hartonius TaxID=425514 RepID=A0A1H3WPY5_9SPHI|nr:SDR family oxidoreductase [Pedobacter hartonius]SDZ89195.1 NAD(P)-dependent dehydrogenase, short-chain alcohol dehydrogenase family [Pedobacter hartonius]